MLPSQASRSSAAQFCISWVSYKNCISNGFSRFQQNGEFVDMTLAAEGHLVKVHQNVVALASPYLKAMILSASCQHPVVFLNNITQEILSYILEYMYTGEVNIPKDVAPAFIDACKNLHISGVENLYLPKRPETEPAKQDVLDDRIAQPPPPPPDNNFAAHITINSDNFNVEVIPNENDITHHLNRPETEPAKQDVLDDRLAQPPPPPDNNFAAHITINSDNFNVEVIPNENDITHHLNAVQPMNISLNEDLMNYQVLTDANIIETENNFEQDFPPLSDCELPSSPLNNTEENQNKTLLYSDLSTINQDSLKPKENHPSTLSTERVIPPRISDRDKVHHYSISNRGSLQLLLNRFMYYCHHHSCEGRKRRWRCMDYRKLHCPAIIDTDNENIINRSEVHSHPDHDLKIVRKFKSKQVFTSLSQAKDRVSTEKPAKGKSRKRVVQKMNVAK